jgi:SAM-dependent methyltransferase
MMNPAQESAVPDGMLRARFDDAEAPAPAREEIDWLSARLPRDAGSVLDAMCGSGRVLVPLAQRGHAMQGADVSQAALAIAEARLASAGHAAALYRQDLPALNLPTRFGAAILAGGAFQRIVDPSIALAGLVRLRAHLVDPAILIVDARLPDYAGMRPAAPLVELRSVSLPDGSQIRMRSETSIDADAKLARTDARYTHRRGARSLGEEHARHSLTWYDEDELAALVSQAGWRDVAVERPAWAASGASFVVVARG